MPIEFESAGQQPAAPRRTPLHALHLDLGARMVTFAGTLLPVQYPAGILAEHAACRTGAALFDVSHMGQLRLHGAGAAAALEALCTADLLSLPPMRQRYALLTNAAGGILDDAMVARLGEDVLHAVVNASRQDDDAAHIAAHLPEGVALERLDGQALLALQGPGAAAALGALWPDAGSLAFMALAQPVLCGVPCLVSRSGYTGEDGFEISVPAPQAEALARALLAQPGVVPAGLGARDSLRLEAGLCLYGQDIDELTSPVEAGLAWAIGRRRRADGGFPGAAVVQGQLAHGVPRQRVGIRPDGRAPARALTDIVAEDGTAAGTVTSGTFSPTLGAPIAMGYVRHDLAAVGTALSLVVRGTRQPARIVPLPFVAHRYRH